MTRIISILSILPLLMTIFALVFVKTNFCKSITKETRLWLTFIFSFGAIVGSLYFSGVLHYPPCTLCWWARIFIYPVAIISLVGITKKDFSVHLYNLFLSGLAVIVTGYHTYITFGGNEVVSCGTAGSCLARYVMEFGFVTIPTMALFVSLFIFVNSLISIKND